MVSAGGLIILHSAVSGHGISGPGNPDGANGAGGRTVLLQRARTAADAWVGSSRVSRMHDAGTPKSSGEVRLLAGRMPLASCPCLLSADQPLPLCSRGAWCFCLLPSGRARPVLMSTVSRRDGGQSRVDARTLGSHELGPGSGSVPIGGLWASNSKPFKPHFLPLSKRVPT